jgi:PhnB protein
MTVQKCSAPEGYRNLAPYLIIKDAVRAVAYYTEIFGAIEEFRVSDPAGKILFAKLNIGDSQLMLADEFIDWGVKGPAAIGGTPAMVHVYTDNVDDVVDRAVSNGAKLLKPVSDQFTGDRLGQIEDPFGHIWFVSTRKEAVTPQEMQKRASAMFV